MAHTFKDTLRALGDRRFLFLLIFGFASGLPLALTGQAMQAWLNIDGIDIKTIGFFTLVGQPYAFKYLWAPLMDRFEPSFLGKRRSWLIICQLLLAVAIFAMSTLSPKENLALFAGVATLIAFLSASQDIVVDAYRTNILQDSERGMGAALGVLGYRLAMLVSGGLSFFWAESWGWQNVYLAMCGIMILLAALTFFSPKVLFDFSKYKLSNPKKELIGFACMILGVVVGAFVGKYFLVLLGFDPESANKWVSLLFVLTEIAFALPSAYYLGKLGGFQALTESMSEYFSMKGAFSFLVVIVLYKLGDSFAGSLSTAFLLKSGYTQPEIGTINKIFGLVATLSGGLLGGIILLRIGLWRSLLFFGILQALSNSGFWYLASFGKGAWGNLEFSLPWAGSVLDTVTQVSSLQFIWVPFNVDSLLLGVVSFENITGGMGTAASVAFLMSLCSQRFAATHFALLSSFASVGRIYVGPMSGVLSDSLGWPNFYLFSIVAALPGIIAVIVKKREISSLSK